MRARSPLKKIKAPSPIFDFLKTVSVPNTPGPQKVKDKKMFLSLYKSLKTEKKTETKSEKTRHSFVGHTTNQRSALMIEGLIPIPFQYRVNTKVWSSKRSSEKPMRIRVFSKKVSPIPNNISFDLLRNE